RAGGCRWHSRQAGRAPRILPQVPSACATCCPPEGEVLVSSCDASDPIPARKFQRISVFPALPDCQPAAACGVGASGSAPGASQPPQSSATGNSASAAAASTPTL